MLSAIGPSAAAGGGSNGLTIFLAVLAVAGTLAAATVPPLLLGWSSRKVARVDRIRINLKDLRDVAVKARKEGTVARNRPANDLDAQTTMVDAFTAVQAYEALVADDKVRSAGEKWRTYAADFFGRGPEQTMLQEKKLFTALMTQIGTAYRAQKY